MKRRILCAILAFVTLTAFAGCDLAELTGKGNENAQATLNTEPQVDPEPVVDVEEDIYAGVSNNGSFFVGVDGKVYFRQYAEYGIKTVASKRNFLTSGDGGYGNTICYFTPDKPDEIVAVTKEEDQGQGELYYYDGYIYSTRYEWSEGYPHPILYRANLTTGALEDVGKGYIKAASEDGRFIVTDTFEPETCDAYTIYDAGKEIASYKMDRTNVYNELIAVDANNLYIFMADNNTCDGSICQYDYINDKFYYLDYAIAPEGIDEYISYPVIKDGVIKDKKLSFSLLYCEGNGAYVQDAYDITVDINEDPKAVTDSALFTKQASKNSKYYTGNPSDFIDVPNNLASLEVVESGDNGFARVIQCIEQVYDKTYVIVADCFYSAQWNQAELGSYDLLDVDYYYYDDANTTPTLFNDDNPTDHTLMVRAWFVGKKGETPKKLLFQHASISGPEGPQEFDPALYTAEFSDDFKFSHIPENGDIYDDFETDGMDYMVKYFNDDYYNPYVETLTEADEFTHYEVPKMDWNDPNSTTFSFLHIGFDRDGKINFIRQVIMD